MICSYNERCGMAEYTKSLVEDLITKGIDVKVAANYSNDPTESDQPYVGRFFHVGFMDHKRGYDIDGMVEFFKDRDIIHCQYEPALYDPILFEELFLNFKTKLKVKTVFTTHTASFWNTFDLRLIDHCITHSHMWCSGTIIPPGVKFFDNTHMPTSYTVGTSSICSLPNSRNLNNLVEGAIKGTNIRFDTNITDGKWVNIDTLALNLSKSWIISLIYPEIDNILSSSAVTLAMGLQRPILISNTNWFQHVIDYPGLYICSNVEDTKDNIEYLCNPFNYKKICEELSSRKQKLIDDGRAFDNFVNKHIGVYRNLLS